MFLFYSNKTDIVDGEERHPLGRANRLKSSVVFSRRLGRSKNDDEESQNVLNQWFISERSEPAHKIKRQQEKESSSGGGDG